MESEKLLRQLISGIIAGDNPNFSKESCENIMGKTEEIMQAVKVHYKKRDLSGMSEEQKNEARVEWTKYENKPNIYKKAFINFLLEQIENDVSKN